MGMLCRNRAHATISKLLAGALRCFMAATLDKGAAPADVPPVPVQEEITGEDEAPPAYPAEEAKGDTGGEEDAHSDDSHWESEEEDEHPMDADLKVVQTDGSLADAGGRTTTATATTSAPDEEEDALIPLTDFVIRCIQRQLDDPFLPAAIDAIQQLTSPPMPAAVQQCVATMDLLVLLDSVSVYKDPTLQVGGHYGSCRCDSVLGRQACPRLPRPRCAATSRSSASLRLPAPPRDAGTLI